MLKIENLSVSIAQKTILSQVSLQIKEGEVVALMGPNGSGKSTLASTLAGHPLYTVTGGSIELDKKALQELAPEERAVAGLFVAFQHPASIPGVSVSQFTRLAMHALQKARGEKLIDSGAFLRELRTALKKAGLPVSFASRSVNDGFSGGEKKRLELAQMYLLKPKVIILDEIDSGLDIDALRLTAEVVGELKVAGSAVLIITHYQRILDYLTPDKVAVLKEGKIIKTGGAEVAKELEKTGYATL